MVDLGQIAPNQSRIVLLKLLSQKGELVFKPEAIYS